MKVFVTKYALTEGIVEFPDVEEVAKTPGMISDKTARFGRYFHGEGKEWHRTREEAVKRAEEMRSKKIASLQKQIKKLEKLKFE